MTPQQIIDQYEELTGESLSDESACRLITQAKNKVEADLKLEILKAVDSSQTASVGDSYLTMKTLNSNVRIPLKVVVNNITHFPCSFVNREAFRFAARRYYIDWKNRQFALTGRIATAGTIYMYYLSKTPDVTVDDLEDATIIVWPDEFKPLIAYEMAAIQQGNIDADAVSIEISPKQKAEAQAIKDSFIAWDADIKLAAMNNQGGFQDDVEGDPLDLIGRGHSDLGMW